MDKPLCKLCGHKHYGTEHIWDKETKPKGEPAPVDLSELPTGTTYIDNPVTMTERQAVIGKGKDKTVVKLKKFDRVAYQREYMRKWRKRNKS